ncbi:hypothetical protein STAS_32204, partial [Striga asiatica]
EFGCEFVETGVQVKWATRPAWTEPTPRTRHFCSSAGGGGGGDRGDGQNAMTHAEAKRLMRLVNVEELKEKLGVERKEVIPYAELLKACEGIGAANSADEAAAFARVLDEAGVVLLFRDRVYLHPDKKTRAKDELRKLEEKKEEIDMLAHKQVRRILWAGLGLAMVQVGLFFRLTFWELSWDVMEPIAFFTTTSSIVLGYAYFLFTSRDPSYQDLLKRLFLSRHRKLVKKYNFDIKRFVELQRMTKLPLESCAAIKRRTGRIGSGGPFTQSLIFPGFYFIDTFLLVFFRYLSKIDQKLSSFFVRGVLMMVMIMNYLPHSQEKVSYHVAQTDHGLYTDY